MRVSLPIALIDRPLRLAVAGAFDGRPAAALGLALPTRSAIAIRVAS